MKCVSHEKVQTINGTDSTQKIVPSNDVLNRKNLGMQNNAIAAFSSTLSPVSISRIELEPQTRIWHFVLGSNREDLVREEYK